MKETKIVGIKFRKEIKGKKLYHIIKKVVKEMEPDIEIITEDITTEYNHQEKGLIEKKIESYIFYISKKVKKQKKGLFRGFTGNYLEEFVAPLFILGKREPETNESIAHISGLYFNKKYSDIGVAIIKGYRYSNPSLDSFKPNHPYGLGYSEEYDFTGEKFKKEVVPILDELIEKIKKNLNEN